MSSIKYKPYTLIGSRVTPQDILDLMTKVVTKLCSLGYTGRSGGADGADSCLEAGCKIYIECIPTKLDSNLNVICSWSKCMEVYLPWRGFNGRGNGAGYYIVPNIDKSIIVKATSIAESVHPAWDKCTRGARGLHIRNIMQVLGKDLIQPTKFVICYAKPKGNHPIYVQGGTATAVKLAHDNGAEIFNLYYEEVQQRFIKFLS
jgi:hypothetical protein